LALRPVGLAFLAVALYNPGTLTGPGAFRAGGADHGTAPQAMRAGGEGNHAPTRSDFLDAGRRAGRRRSPAASRGWGRDSMAAPADPAAARPARGPEAVRPGPARRARRPAARSRHPLREGPPPRPRRRPAVPHGDPAVPGPGPAERRP